ncbi:Uncharacterised protein [Shigella sonnei]|nr:Uncharacterised protein [Shigella sonnei]CSE96501.1 Uncharacterised protein [Shigella sonnei]CSF19619.1 Uncharacterised protein [Shigella sonnei]CSF54281.1 Uncharacterised protein [Shigella sonnei]CSG33234.1 Uncharacterised protein [Shigella sonnei]
MCRYHTTKDFCRFTVVQHCLQFRARFGVIFRQFAGDKHLHAQRHRDIKQTRVTILTRQELHRFTNFNRVTCTGGQYLIHVGEQRGGAHASAVSHANNRFGKGFREFVGRHKRAATHFHVHHQRVQTFRKFLRQNRGGDQRDGVHGCGNITGRVETFIRRSQ